MCRRWLAILAVAILVIAAITVAEFFVLTVADRSQGVIQAHNQYQPVYASLVQLFLGAWRWLLDRLDHNTITTIAIIATALFTGTLWSATRQLQKTSKIHARHLEESVTAAKAAADAAKEGNRLAREQFNIDVRPWIAVDDLIPIGPIFLDQNGLIIDVEIAIRNVGRSPARNITTRYRGFARIQPELYGSENFKTAHSELISQAATGVPPHGRRHTLSWAKRYVADKSCNR
jgi:hypothetical protein